ncbi:Proteolipid protein 2 [Malassezia sp. CBS 17886]|nr:Proteolipid protein 2 [Malassezia sp. CBS 17886]
MAQVQVDPAEDTEFHDALRAHGIIPQKPPSREPSPEPPSAAERTEAARRQASVADLDEELETADDDEERILRRLRQERLHDMAAAQRSARFGRVFPVARPDYTREVTDASREPPPGAPSTDHNGTGVVCFLYKPGLEECELMKRYLDVLADRYPNSKFVSMIGDQCIPNYPDKNLPTLLIYRGGEMRRQIVGLRPEIGLDGMKTTLADVELLLSAVGAIDPPKPPPTKRGDEEDDEEERGRGVRAQTQDEEDADLDWD